MRENRCGAPVDAGASRDAESAVSHFQRSGRRPAESTKSSNFVNSVLSATVRVARVAKGVVFAQPHHALHRLRACHPSLSAMVRQGEGQFPLFPSRPSTCEIFLPQFSGLAASAAAFPGGARSLNCAADCAAAYCGRIRRSAMRDDLVFWTFPAKSCDSHIE